MAECNDDSSMSNNVNTQKQKAVIVQSDQTDDSKTDQVAEPILVEEIQGNELPKSYRILREKLLERGQPLESARDVLVALVYVLMLEKGFVPLDFPDDFEGSTYNFSRRQVEHLAGRIPENWKRADNLYSFAFVLKPYPLFICRIVCTVCLDDLVVNCRVQGLQHANYAILVDATQYVITSRTKLGTVRFQNVKSFACNFKNQIADRAKVQILHCNGVTAACLQDLPAELQLLLQKYHRQLNCDWLLPV